MYSSHEDCAECLSMSEKTTEETSYIKGRKRTSRMTCCNEAEADGSLGEYNKDLLCDSLMVVK